MSNIQSVDGIYHVVRAFESEEVIHVDDSVDPIRDLETIVGELCLKDLTFLEVAVNAENKAIKANPTMKLSPTFISAMAKVRELLEARKPVRDGDFSNGEVEMINNK